MDELLDPELAQRLLELADRQAPHYRSADPFPHGVFDDFLPQQPVLRALEAFPDPDSAQWEAFAGKHERKLALYAAERLPTPLRDLLYFLNSPILLQFLERLTGIQGLIGDPYFFGGGLHQIVPGGFLDIHADFSHHQQLNLDRRLNLLLYLNRDWDEAYGGHLELWDPSMQHCVGKILPLLNRCVVFTTTDTSYHGHPTPLTCPQGKCRKSIAVYYYTAPTANEPERVLHSTLFKQPQSTPTDNQQPKKVLRQVIPSFVLDAWRSLRRRPSRD